MRKAVALFSIATLLALPAAGAAEGQAGEPKTFEAPAAGSAAQPPPPAAAIPDQKGTERAVRIGYADILRIGGESIRGKAAQTRLKEKTDKYQAQIDTRKKQLEKQKGAVEAKLATLAPRQRVARAKEFEKKVAEYRKFAENAEKELQTLQEELTRQLYQEIEQAASTYGKANGYAAIVVKKELLYLASGVEAQDVTDEILKLVNEKGEKP